MEFSEKLVTLMDIYRISNAKLAKGIKVDPSLVSRWKSGERQPAKGSGAEREIALFLSAQKMLPTDRRVLSLTLGEACDTGEQTDAAISKWLLDPNAGIAPLYADSARIFEEPPEPSADYFETTEEFDSAEFDTDTPEESDDEPESESESEPEPFDYFDSDDLDLDEEDEEPEYIFDEVKDDDPDVAMPTQTLEVLHHLLLEPPKSIENRPVNLWPRVMKGQPFDHELFRGTAGKRQAAINFLHAVLSHNKPVDVYMMSQEESSWIDEDPIFTDLWNNALMQIARHGHKMHIIHTTAGNPDELPQIIEGFMPLYASGRLNSYYRKDHQRDLALPTIFVAKGLCAVISYCSTGHKNCEYTLLYKNNWDTVVFEDLYNTYLEDSKLLASACARRGMRAYAEQVAIFEHGEGDRILLKNSLSGLWLTEQVLYKYMSSQLKPEDSAFFLDLFARRRENFENMIKSNKWVEIISRTVIDAVAQNGTCLLPGRELFCPGDVTLNGEDLKLYLNRILEFLRNYDNFEVIFLDDMPIAINMMLRHGVSACFTATAEPESPAAVLIGEEAFLKSMDKYFRAVLPEHNKKETRDKTISEIEYAIESLADIR